MKLVAILRAPQGLSAVISRRRPDADLNALVASPEANHAGFYEILDIPLADVPTALCPQKQTLLTAWTAIESVASLNNSVEALVSMLLQETVLGLTDAPKIPIELPASIPKPIAPTAAHPRAYRGTKYQPPRIKTPVPVDLRTQLCIPQNAVDQERLFPALFRVYVWPCVKAQGEETVHALLAQYWSLQLDTDTHLLPNVVRLLCLQKGNVLLPWLDLLAELPSDRRVLFADLLLETQAYELESLSDAERNFLLLTGCGRHVPSRLYSVFRALKHGIPWEYLDAGFRLDDESEKPFAFHELPWEQMSREAYYPEGAVQNLGQDWRISLRYLWQQCSTSPCIGHIVDAVDWKLYSSEIQGQFLDFYQGFAYNATGSENTADCWAIAAKNVPRFTALLQATPPEYQIKLLTSLRYFCANWDYPQTLSRCLPSLDIFLRRLCRSPFRRECDIQSVGTDFLEFLDAEQQSQFLAAPDTCFLRLEDACRRNNDAGLCGFGTWTLGKYRPDWLLSAFLRHPAKLFKVCKLLGSFSHAYRERIVRGCDFVNVSAPPPHLLHEHTDGSRTLPPAQLAHYQELWQGQTILKQLEHLERAALASLGNGFPSDPMEESVRHALQMQFQADENRPALRRFLKAYWNGQTDYLETHPQTQQWLKHHPHLDVDLWRQGIAFLSDSAVTISVEQNPLEALKLGTYVGSCLALGGICAYSASAVVLDINKQVLYARRDDGTVLARQLVAISEDNQLVCFSVYPHNASAEIKRHFMEYNHQFAQALGLALWREGSLDYTIQTILAQRWWDDDAWPGKKSYSPG
jgi:hypothetical protein